MSSPLEEIFVISHVKLSSKSISSDHIVGGAVQLDSLLERLWHVQVDGHGTVWAETMCTTSRAPVSKYAI